MYSKVATMAEWLTQWITRLCITKQAGHALTWELSLRFLCCHMGFFSHNSNVGQGHIQLVCNRSIMLMHEGPPSDTLL